MRLHKQAKEALRVYTCREKAMTESQRQVAQGNYIAQAHGRGAQATVQIGLSSEELSSLLLGVGVAHQAKLDGLARQLNASREAVTGFLRILREDDVSSELLAPKLELIARRHLNLVSRLGILDPENEIARRSVEAARDVIARAASREEYCQADELLLEAEQSQHLQVGQAEKLAKDAQIAVKRLRAGEAGMRAERAELSLLRLDYIGAAKHFRVASEMIDPSDFETRIGYSIKEFDALATYGEERGDNTVLMASAEKYRAHLSNELRTDYPRVWSKVEHHLGHVLAVLGSRDAGDEHLNDALLHFESSLSERNRYSDPELWAETQNEIGVTLIYLSSRQCETTSLERAEQAFRSVLQVRRHETNPLEWAETQNDLGNVLVSLGIHDSSDLRLEEAIAAYRFALIERTKARTPLKWAETQSCLGNALRLLSQRSKNTAKVKEAVEAYQLALQERTRERCPLDWAATMNNLGNALNLFGRWEQSPATIADAIDVFRSVLQEWRRERTPLDWARVQNNLGNALRDLGDLGTVAENYEEAIAAYRVALTERKRENTPLEWARTNENLAVTSMKLHRRCANGEYLEEGLRAIEQACRFYSEAGIERHRVAAENLERKIRALLAKSTQQTHGRS